jgi:hypothetical protein
MIFHDGDVLMIFLKLNLKLSSLSFFVPFFWDIYIYFFIKIFFNTPLLPDL